MESTSNRKRKQPLSNNDQEYENAEDVDMNMEGETTSVESQQRKIIKPKKRHTTHSHPTIIEEDGQEIEFEGDELEYEEENVV